MKRERKYKKIKYLMFSILALVGTLIGISNGDYYHELLTMVVTIKMINRVFCER